MEEVTREEPEREEVDVKDETEILPDGTIHSVHEVVHHKVKHVHRSRASQSGEEEVYEGDEEVPGSAVKKDVLEMYEQPPKLVQDTEEIEEVLPDGTKVKKQVVMSRMVHLIKMHHESFDEEHGKIEEEYEIEEVIPGTESAFVAGLDSDYEEEVEMKQQAAKEAEQQAMGEEGAEGEGPATAAAKLVSYQHGSEVDGSANMYDFGSETVVPATSQGVVESTMDVVEDMIAKGQLTLEDTEGKPACGLPPPPLA